MTTSPILSEEALADAAEALAQLEAEATLGSIDNMEVVRVVVAAYLARTPQPPMVGAEPMGALIERATEAFMQAPGIGNAHLVRRPHRPQIAAVIKVAFAASPLDRASVTVKALDDLDAAWCQFVNCRSDPTGDKAYDEAEEQKNVYALGAAFDRLRALKVSP